MDVITIPALEDNYSYLVIDPKTREAAVVDCAEPEPVLAQAQARGVRLVSILSTHHHWDHVAGNETLLSKTRLRICGYREDGGRIPGLTDGLSDGETFVVGCITGRAIFVPGHTSDHLAYYFPEAGALFTGDTMFVGGCGRLFEGNAAQMMVSLAKLCDLPDETLVYCGHEYTEKNLRFAETLEPSNVVLRHKLEAIRQLRSTGKPTVPSTIGSEKATNPFLRVECPELQTTLRGRFPSLLADPVAVFAKTRELKDRF